jgi:hypothetical protein
MGVASGVLLALGLCACVGDDETHRRTLPSGREIDVSHMLGVHSESGLRLSYTYVSTHFDDKAVFDAEWTEFVQYVQREADEGNAVEFMVIAHRGGGSALSRLFTENERVSRFTKRTGQWTEDKLK